MKRRSANLLTCWIAPLAAGPVLAVAQTVADPRPSLCTHQEQPGIDGAAAAAAELKSWDALGDAGLVLEYGSVYDVHSPLDPGLPPRSQAGSFHTNQILQDLECFVDPWAYDFVLLYSVSELPGWIHSGPRGIPAPAKNIGLPNTYYGLPSAFAAWPRLLLAPHMNSLNFVIQDSPPNFGVLAAMHEMGHAWGVLWAQQSGGPREWQSSDPVAWLAACCGHWSWNWVEDALPGMMYSAPTQPRFNDFDLYAMGLISYDQTSGTTHEVYEDSGTGTPGPAHQVGLDDLIYSLSIQGATYFEGDGRRFPLIDPNAPALTALLVVIRGSDQVLTNEQELAVTELALDLPPWWQAATLGLSQLTVRVMRSAPIDADADAVLDCLDNCPQVVNPSQINVDGDELGDVCDPCPHVSHPSLWDLDHRNGFNLLDIRVFQNCFSGSGPVNPACAFADFSNDGRIDSTDFIPLAELLTGHCE